MNKPHIGNIVLVTAKVGQEILLLHKLPHNEKDDIRKAEGKRQRVGIDKWGPAGGGNKKTDPSDVHAAWRETIEETGLQFPIDAFIKIGMLEGFSQRPETLDHVWTATIYSVVAWPDMKDKIVIDPEEHDKFGWYSIKDIDELDMIESDKEWLPQLLKQNGKGKHLSIRVIFDGDSEKVLSCYMDEAKFR